jgi:hypothetical protein
VRTGAALTRPAVSPRGAVSAAAACRGLVPGRDQEARRMRSSLAFASSRGEVRGAGCAVGRPRIAPLHILGPDSGHCTLSPLRQSRLTPPRGPHERPRRNGDRGIVGG